METYNYQIVEDSDPVVREIDSMLTQRNKEIGISWNPEPLCIVATDSEGNIVGGLTGHTHFGWLHIRKLAVVAQVQGRGCGKKLVETAEAAAKARGCGFAHVDTFTFQAPGFYQKLGYEVVGSLDNYPYGHKRVYLRKSLL